MHARRLPRSAGLLLHPTSLPGPHGIGDFGPDAYAFVDALAVAGQTVWQMLPLGPTGYGNSPYAARSAFAGNPLLISLDRLAADGLLEAADLQAAPGFAADRVDYPAVERFKLVALARAADRFPTAASSDQRSAFETFRESERGWLNDYALFMALRDAHGRGRWQEWEPELAMRDNAALARGRADLVSEVDLHAITQFLFFQQWGELRAYANQRGVRLVGDIPIFVAMDSADVWAHPDRFWLDERGEPTVVAGVPPDYFSATGQRWGNPLYRWEVMAADGYAWWIERLRAMLKMVDVVRIDHFRGFQGCWEIPAELETAERGQWVPAPGREVFGAARAALGDLAIIAEDLGVITPDVVALREELGCPGMKVLQFAFDSGPDNPFLPHNFLPNVVVYTGTHDNDTTVGWFESRQGAEREYALRYVDGDGAEIAWDLIRLAMASVGDTAIVPVQDVLGLGAEARMNYPGRSDGNWEWRLQPGQLTADHLGRLRGLTDTYGRLPP